MTTDLVVRPGLDLTRAPDERWNEEMVQMVAAQLFRGRASTKGELYYCLSVAEGVGLNPLVGEIYFIPSKSRDGGGPTLQPYIGRNGLVKKATERRTYFESDTVHANDRFRYTRRKDGSTEVTHSYGSQERGPIVGAYAFLHDDDGRRKPAFFYAEWDQYVPTFDADWKLKASPWGNQASAMIEKCAMIGAGRKRLDLGNVLIDGEIPRYEQQAQVGPGGPGGGEPAEPVVFDWESLEAPDELTDRLRIAVDRVNDLAPASWPAAKLEMVLLGRPDDELAAIAGQIEDEANRLASRAVGGAAGRSGPAAGDSSSVEADAVEGVTDAEVVEPMDPDRAAGLRKRRDDLAAAVRNPDLDETDQAQARDELERVERELAAAEDAGQERMPL